jgi:hypothetical protein
MIYSGTNASAERVFSMMKLMWANYRSELSVDRIKAMMTIKFNTNQTCLEFYESIKNRPDILKAIKSMRAIEV